MKFDRKEIQAYPAVLIKFTAKKQTTYMSVPMPDYDNVNPDIEGTAKQTVNAIYYFIDENINGQLDGCDEPIELIESDLIEPLNHIYEKCENWLQRGAKGDVSFAKYLIDKHHNNHNVDIVLSKSWCLLGK